MTNIQKNNLSETINKEKLSTYLQNKKNKLEQQGYRQIKNIGLNEVIYSDTIDINKQEIVKLLVDMIPGEPLKGEHETIPSHLAGGIQSGLIQKIISKINDRTMTEEEYQKLMNQVEKYGSILADTNKREWDFGGGGGDLILSLTTGKMYDVENGNGLKELLQDYKGKQYYSSRSGASGAGFLFSGKASLIYLPIMRVDVAHPEGELRSRDVNGLNMSVLTNRGMVNEEYPTVIKDCAGVDVVLLSQKDHLSPDGSGKLLGEVIKSKGACLKKLPVKTFTTEYYDENLEKQTVSFTYKTNMDPKDIKFNDIGKWFLDIKRGFNIETTGRFVDNMVGLRKYKDKYVRLGTFGLIKEVYEENPIKKEEDKFYIDEIEIGSSNKIEHKKIEVPLSTDYTGNINGWEIKNNLAVRRKKKVMNMSKYDFEQICANHSINPEYIYAHRKDESASHIAYDLVYEKRMSELHKNFSNLEGEYMEYEDSIPSEIYDIYPRSYWEKYMEDMLFAKAYNEWKNSSNRSTEEQKKMSKQYLKKNPTKKFILSDSYAVGNCKEGTKRFIDTFNLSESGILAKDLSKNPHLNRMLEDSRFRAVLLKKVLEAEFVLS